MDGIFENATAQRETEPASSDETSSRCDRLVVAIGPEVESGEDGQLRNGKERGMCVESCARRKVGSRVGTDEPINDKQKSVNKSKTGDASEGTAKG